jgi:glycosyltransferase involved in cell wall biosynthesis
MQEVGGWRRSIGRGGCDFFQTQPDPLESKLILIWDSWARDYMICEPHAGGYDPRVVENREHHLELVHLAQSLGLSVSDYPDCSAQVGTLHPALNAPCQPSPQLICFGSFARCFHRVIWFLTNVSAHLACLFLPRTRSDQVIFLRSFDDAQRNFLLTRSTAVLYTPENEHFGIVPVEAMFMRRPVVACASGGPLESIGADASRAIAATAPTADRRPVGAGRTAIDDASRRGYLCESSAAAFAAPMRVLEADLLGSGSGVSGGAMARRMGANGRAAMLALFSFDAFAAKLCAAVRAQLQLQSRSSGAILIRSFVFFTGDLFKCLHPKVNVWVFSALFLCLAACALAGWIRVPLIVALATAAVWLMHVALGALPLRR